ncbi:MAG TPA: hypothetical protein VGQ49_13505 [Bryobacteraceae bacterium]|jgi:hypothetical protein|nr:hypothetical protein [Bryobacteraceae bacterium]
MHPALNLPPIPVEQLFAQVQDQLDKVSAFLPALNRGEGPDDNCYRGIFKGLLIETRDGFTNAVEAWKAKDYRRLAWATRSLVELKLWTKYVIASKENALAINREYDVDGSNLWALLKPVLNTDAGQQLFSQVFSMPVLEMTTKIQQHLESVGLTGDEDFMRMAQVAKEVGLTAEYKYTNSILSKFVHATGLSILVPPERAEILMPLNCIGACVNTNQILGDVHGHLPKVGLPTF